MQNNENIEIYKLFNELIVIAIDDIYNNQIDKALNLIIKIMEFYEEIKTIIDPSEMNEIDNVLNSILIASEKKDYILVADLLEYELNDLLAAIIDR